MDLLKVLISNFFLIIIVRPRPSKISPKKKRWIAFNSNVLQPATVIEGTIPNVGDAIEDSYTPQTTAVIEGLIPNAGDAISNSYSRQITALPEGLIPNACEAVANRHARQAFAIIEGLIPNAGDAIGYS